MNDTVTRLMGLADDYAYNKAEAERAHLESWHSKAERETLDADVDVSRQALQDELVRLFTPVEASEITKLIRGMDVDTLEDLCSFSFRTGVRWAEEAHGITGDSKRCPLCNYQHGHQIGCKNNPVDIALQDGIGGES